MNDYRLAHFAPGARSYLAGGLAAVMLLLALTTPAQGIPAFARKYRATCALCHSPFPRLNAFGEQFAANGFEMAPGEAPSDTISTGDPMLRLQSGLPLAIRMESYLNGLAKKGDDMAATDLQTPWGIKLLTGGQVADGISYYMYFFLSERGEIAGLEDAYLQFTDVAGTGVNLIAGQFQVSDPLFKRELRLEYDDYQLYRARVGEVRADMTYDRGLLAFFSPWEGADVAVMLVNGQGIAQAGENRLFDTDKLKNSMIRYSQELGSVVRLGGFVYFGQEKKDDVLDNFHIWGPDMTLALGPRTELNAQFIRREDNNPFFLPRCPWADPRCDAKADHPLRVTTDGFLAELLFYPQGAAGRWTVSGLYNWVDSSRPALSLRMGEEGFLTRYETVAMGATYLLKRNIRAMGEMGYDMETERYRMTLGVVAGF